MVRDKLPVLTIAGWQCLFDEAREFVTDVSRTRIQYILNEANRQEIDLTYDLAFASYSKAADYFESSYLAKKPISNNQRVKQILKDCGLRSGDFFIGRLMSDLQMSHSNVGMSVVPFAKEFLKYANRYYRIVLLCDTWMSTGSFIDRFLDKNGLMEFFDHRIYSDQTGCHKINGTAFSSASQLLDVEVSTFVHVGDFWESDVLAAAHAGVGRIIWVKRDNHPLPSIAQNSIDLPVIPTVCNGLEEAKAKL